MDQEITKEEYEDFVKSITELFRKEGWIYKEFWYEKDGRYFICRPDADDDYIPEEGI